MKSRIIVMSLCALSVSCLAQAQVYPFSFKDWRSSTFLDFTLTPASYHVRSDFKDVRYSSSESGITVGAPIFARIYSGFSFGLSPTFNVVEVGSSFSLSLSVPFSLGLSSYDVLDSEGDRPDLHSNSVYSLSGDPLNNNRSLALGFGHLDFGGMLSLTYGQGSTKENDSRVGYSIAAGYHQIVGPVFNYYKEFAKNYQPYTRVGIPTGRVGLHFVRIAFYYSFGLNPQIGEFGESDNVRMRTYNHFYCAFRL